jgi:hypothetical protein
MYTLLPCPDYATLLLCAGRLPLCCPAAFEGGVIGDGGSW